MAHRKRKVDSSIQTNLITLSDEVSFFRALRKSLISEPLEQRYATEEDLADLVQTNSDDVNPPDEPLPEQRD